MSNFVWVLSFVTSYMQTSYSCLGLPCVRHALDALFWPVFLSVVPCWDSCLQLYGHPRALQSLTLCPPFGPTLCRHNTSPLRLVYLPLHGQIAYVPVGRVKICSRLHRKAVWDLQALSGFCMHDWPPFVRCHSVTLFKQAKPASFAGLPDGARTGCYFLTQVFTLSIPLCVCYH